MATETTVAAQGVDFSLYDCEIEFESRIIGGIPVVPFGADRADIYEKWARGQGVENDPSYEKPLPEALAEDPDMPVLEEDSEIAGMMCGFRCDREGIYVEARQVKAALRESAQRLGLIVKQRGLRQVLQHDLHVRAVDGSQKLRLYRDGGVVTEPDGEDQRPIAVVTARGPRTTIKRFEYVIAPTIRFRVMILAGGVGDGLLNEDGLRRVLSFAGYLGLGADRSQGEGTFGLVDFSPAGVNTVS